jgi:hypothetical protein
VAGARCGTSRQVLVSALEIADSTRLSRIGALDRRLGLHFGTIAPIGARKLFSVPDQLLEEFLADRAQLARIVL